MNKSFMPQIVGVGMAPILILIIATSQPLFPQASDGNIVEQYRIKPVPR